MRIQEIYGKYNSGKALTDNEVIDAYLHFKQLKELLADSGVEFRVVHRAVCSIYLGFRNLIHARNLHAAVKD